VAKRRGPSPTARVETIRTSIQRVLEEGPATARDLSKAVGIREAEVAPHLEHLERSLRRQGRRLRIEPCLCLDCEFEFKQRKRFTRPGRCPECHGRRLTLPVFFITEAGSPS